MSQVTPLSGNNPDQFFENLKGWMSPQEVAEKFGFSIWTIYKWKNRGKLAGVPDGLFIKFNRKLFIRTEVLRVWISSQNSGGSLPLNF